MNAQTIHGIDSKFESKINNGSSLNNEKEGKILGLTNFSVIESINNDNEKDSSMKMHQKKEERTGKIMGGNKRRFSNNVNKPFEVEDNNSKFDFHTEQD